MPAQHTLRAKLWCGRICCRAPHSALAGGSIRIFFPTGAPVFFPQGYPQVTLPSLRRPRTRHRNRVRLALERYRKATWSKPIKSLIALALLAFVAGLAATRAPEVEGIRLVTDPGPGHRRAHVSTASTTELCPRGAGCLVPSAIRPRPGRRMMEKHRGFPSRLPGTDSQSTIRRPARATRALRARERYLPTPRPRTRRATRDSSGRLSSIPETPVPARLNAGAGRLSWLFGHEGVPVRRSFRSRELPMRFCDSNWPGAGPLFPTFSSWIGRPIVGAELHSTISICAGIG